MPEHQPEAPAIPGTITREELAEALDSEQSGLDSSWVGGRELAVNVFAYVREHREPLVLPPDEFAALRAAAAMLGKIVVDHARAMKAARIELAQGSAGKAMEWILNSLPDVWEDEETEWDGRESADEWWDRTDGFYRAAGTPARGHAEGDAEMARLRAVAAGGAREVKRAIAEAVSAATARAEAAERKLAAIEEMCRRHADHVHLHCQDLGRPPEALVKAAEILAITGDEEAAP